jgi:hypothetical protein
MTHDYKGACHWKIFLWRRSYFKGAKIHSMKGWDGHVFARGCVPFSISDSGLLRSPQYPQGFSLDKVVRGGNHARVHVFLDYYTLVNKSLLTSYGIFQHIQHVLMWDVNSQLIGNYATTLNNFLKRFFQILWWKTFTTHRDMNESILDVEYLMHGGFGVLGLMVF